MSLEPYYFRPATPPSGAVDQLIGSAHSRNTSGSSIYSNNSSPDSVATALTTPSRSPIRQNGPALLPKIRSQDQSLEPSSVPGPKRHRRALSSTRNPPGYTPYPTRPSMQRCVTEPADCNALLSPLSTTSMFGSRGSSTLTSPVTFTPSHSRKPSGSHSRSGSASSVDDFTLSRFGYPTYRYLPTYLSTQSQLTPSTTAYAEPSAAPSLSSAYAYIPYQPQPAVPDETYPLAIEQQCLPEPAVSTSSLLDYLTGPNQAINLVERINFQGGHGVHPHFWWDIRNLRSWDTFNLSTISSIPGLMELLKMPIPSTETPSTNVAASRLCPDSEIALTDLVRDICTPKVNAALKIAQGATSMSLYPCPTTVPGNRNIEPSFLANYPHDLERTIGGSPRGRVIGLVKSFDRWNTGMRNEPPHRKVEYLQGLSHLQRCMREHSCRYGFILTEIELVCVRAGCDEGSDVPYFGYLELAAPIETKTSSANTAPTSRGPPMTVNLALWYLLMLAKHQPLENQPSYHLDVGGPGTLTRQRVLPEGKDKWIPEPQVGEKRNAKRVRGWVMPSDPWHKREGGRGGVGNRRSWNK